MSNPERFADAAALECHELTVRYGETTAVDAISFTIATGEIFGLLGPNGAGKTSVIRALTTIVSPASGAARIAGHDLDDATAVRSVIGVLPESNGYPASQSARSYLRFHGELFGLMRDEADARAERLLDGLGLGRNHANIGTFSRGMRQRLGLCRAMINDPAVLFLDEPTLGLDPGGQEEIMRQLAQLAADAGTAVVLCSHLLDDVERVCDRVGIMHEGRVVAVGTVDEVIAASGVGRIGRVRVGPHDMQVTSGLLHDAAGVRSVDFDPARLGDISFVIGDTPDARRSVVQALLDGAVDLRGFDLQGARLSDAFFALTGANEEVLQ